MPPTTVLQHATAEEARRSSALSDAQDELAAAQAELRQARDDLTEQTDELAELEADIAAIREGLATAPMPADAAALAAELEETTMELRAKQAEVLDAQEAFDAARRRSENAGADLAAAGAASAAAAAALVVATVKDGERSGWKAALGAVPLSNLSGDATGTKASARYTDARDRIAEDLPEALRDRAAERRAAAVERVEALREHLEAAEDDLGDVLAGDTGKPGETEQKRIAFLRADAALRDWARGAFERYQRALALLDSIVAAPPLTQDEHERITDAAIVADGEAGAEKEAARDTARADLEAAKRALEEATLDFLATDPDGDPATDATVQQKEQDVTDAEAALATADGQFTAALHEKLQRWEATVPDGVWRALDAFREATEILDELIAGPGSIAPDATAAEADYAEALDEEAQRARAREQVERALRRRAEAAAAAARSAPTRALSAVRGDA